MVSLLRSTYCGLAALVVGGLTLLAQIHTATAQPDPCTDYLQTQVPICAPPDSDYTAGSFLTWQNNQIFFPNEQRCVYQADDGEVSFTPAFVKPGRSVVIEWTPEPYLQGVSWPKWQEPLGGTIAIQSILTGPSGCSIPPSYVLQRQPIPGADCTGNRCNFFMFDPFGSFIPGHYSAIIDYVGEFNSTPIGGRMYVPIYVAENQLPVANFTAQRISGLRFLMSALSSTDDEALVGFQWDIPGLVPPLDPRSTQSEFELEFGSPGEYFVKLTVEDADGEFSIKQETITITEEDTTPPAPEADVSTAALTASVEGIKQRLAQVKQKPSKKIAAAQKALRAQIKSDIAALQELVNANLGAIATKSPKTNLSKLLKSIRAGANKALRRQDTFKADRKSAVKRLNQFVRALA